MQHFMLRRNTSVIIYLYQRFPKTSLALLKPIQEMTMASTAHITDFQTTGVEGKGVLARIAAGLMLAFEARAIYRVQQEAGHLLTEQQIAAMKADFARRKAAVNV
jgi:hypothetical protein